MNWSFRPDQPIYLQLQEQIRLLIVSGVYLPGSKLPTVRELAVEASVNPNTLQKALAELERDGLVFTLRTSGRYVTEDVDMIANAKKDLAMEQIRQFFQKMKSMGYDKKAALNLVESAAKEEEQ
ncbi:GntR family transcriptional regulator [Papillibacter cinnamivorans]|uniref:DNA-binding transcriptional regulator YhcF, GntR family n=1 Tax=Papillibacter cinnamivorans DSM 12816 TaxID=1122930 RepID=A0A1W2B851_9FIRM|nr:GntR family transcriptional regulator [Papillibacter cinnamivorans]SMC68951.1 DNA-binding transcriptional regulator YhcF, GntR family [Papillibacter cinnamivorans DSM 12816]